MEKNRYAMSEDLATTTHHPYGKGAAKLTVIQLVNRGKKAGHSYSHVAKELQQLANIEKNTAPMASQKFREAAHLARVKARVAREYGKSCKNCGKIHYKL